MRIIACTLLLTLLSVSLIAQSKYKWQRVYEDDDVTIDMDISKVIFNSDDIGRVTFRWVWTVPRALKRTPGVSYKSRIEVTEIDCERRRFRTTTDVKLFDTRGKQISFDAIVPSKKWDNVTAGGIIDEIFEPSCKLIESNRR